MGETKGSGLFVFVRVRGQSGVGSSRIFPQMQLAIVIVSMFMALLWLGYTVATGRRHVMPCHASDSFRLDPLLNGEC